MNEANSFIDVIQERSLGEICAKNLLNELIHNKASIIREYVATYPYTL